MSELSFLIRTEFLLGLGVGFFTGAFVMLQTSKDHHNHNASQSKIKLSSKQQPPTQDLKKVYYKQDNKLNQQQNQTQTLLNKQEQNLQNKNEQQKNYDVVKKKVKLNEHQYEQQEDTSIQLENQNQSDDSNEQSDSNNLSSQQYEEFPSIGKVNQQNLNESFDSPISLNDKNERDVKVRLEFDLQQKQIE